MSITAARIWTTLALFGVFAGVAVFAQEPQPTTQSPSGRTEAPADPPPPTTGDAKYAIDKRLTMFQKIRDDAIFPWADAGARHLEDATDDKLEERAYDEVLRHARQFTTAELEEHARRDVLPRDLYTNGRLDYKLDLIYFEGVVRTIRKARVSELLEASGVTDLYEAWMFPDGSQEAMCVYVTELPPGMTVPKDARDMVYHRVSVAGYYFKLLKYKSREADRAEPGEYRSRRAPVLIGRAFTLRDGDPTAGMIWRQAFLPLIVGGVALVAFTILGLAWYFRRGDAAVRREIDKKLTDNPFANE